MIECAMPGCGAPVQVAVRISRRSRSTVVTVWPEEADAPRTGVTRYCASCSPLAVAVLEPVS